MTIVSRRALFLHTPALAAGAALPLPPRPILAASGSVNITAFGASPTATAAVNTAAVYATLAAAGPGGTVVVPAGRYLCAPVVLSGAAGLRLRGPGTLVGENAPDQLMAVVNSSDVTIDGLGLSSAASNVALYAYASPGLTLRGLISVGGRFAGLFLDRCPAPVLDRVTVRSVHGGIGTGVWVIRGGSDLHVAGLTVEDVDGNALSLDAGTTNDPDAARCDGATLSNLVLRRWGQAHPDAAALHLAGARNVTVTGLRAEGGRHGVNAEQDQSALVTDTVALTGALFTGLTGYAVALIGAQNVSVSVTRWDGQGAGTVYTSAGARGAAPTGNNVSIDAPAARR